MFRSIRLSETVITKSRASDGKGMYSCQLKQRDSEKLGRLQFKAPSNEINKLLIKIILLLYVCNLY